ncbi:MAG: hypothetical protein V4692_13610 [Bdellovibrionota bacterium]
MRRTLLNVLPLALAISCLPVFSFGAETDFAEEKKKSLEALEMRLTQVQKAKVCMTAATDRDGLRDCRRSMHDDLSEMHQKVRRERSGRKK